MHLDYQEIKDKKLRLHVEKSIPAVAHFEGNDPLFLNAEAYDKYLWNFHVHHDAPYPSMDSEFELTMQIVRPLALPYLLSVVACYFGFFNPTFARIWFGALTTGPLVTLYIPCLSGFACLKRCLFFLDAKDPLCGACAEPRRADL